MLGTHPVRSGYSREYVPRRRLRDLLCTAPVPLSRGRGGQSVLEPRRRISCPIESDVLVTVAFRPMSHSAQTHATRIHVSVTGSREYSIELRGPEWNEYTHRRPNRSRTPRCRQ